MRAVVRGTPWRRCARPARGPPHPPPGVGRTSAPPGGPPGARQPAGMAACACATSGGRAAGAWRSLGRGAPHRAAPPLPLPRRRAEDGVGIGKAVWASVDRTSLTNASRQAGEHVTQRGHHTHRPGAWAGCNRQRLAGYSQEYPRSPHPREAKQPAPASQRRRLKAQERRARERRQAQHAAQRLEPALQALGLPPNLVSASEGRCRRQQKRLSQIVGMRCPPWWGGRTNPTRCRGRGGDKHLPSRLRGALPKRSWRQRLRR